MHERLAHAVIASLLDPYILIAAGILAVRSLTFAKAGTLGWHWLVLIGFFIASVAVALSTGGVSFNRYTFAGTGSLAAALVITTSWRKPRQLIPTRFEGAAYKTLRTPIVLIAAIAVSAVVLVLATSTRVVSGVRNYAQQKIDFRYGAFRQSQAEENSFQAVAKLIPDGAHVLVSLSHAFLLPHANFTILFNDQPGRAGPPPFWSPSLDGRQTLKYLQDRGVDFLLVGSDFALPPPQAPGASLSQWDEKLRESGVWFARLVSSELSARTIYHDRFLRLIDLRP